MAEIHPPGREPAQAKRGFHAVTFIVTVADIDQGPMNLAVKLRQNVREPGLQPGRLLFERGRQQTRDFLNRDLARELSGRRAAHAVAHGEREIGRFR